MKKIISVSLILVLALCGCKNSRSNIKPVTSGITFTAELTYYNECCEATVSVTENGAADFEITSPDTVKGLTFHFEGDSVTAEYLGLEYKTDFAALPEGNACIKLYKILKDASGGEISVTADGDDCYISRDSGGVRYKLYLGATGLPLKAEDASGGFTAVFKNVTIQKSDS
ncbi:MAG: hypothetical protein ACI4F7_02665 [Acutalibacteraceae bacterium]